MALRDIAMRFSVAGADAAAGEIDKVGKSVDNVGRTTKSATEQVAASHAASMRAMAGHTKTAYMGMTELEMGIMSVTMRVMNLTMAAALIAAPFVAAFAVIRKGIEAIDELSVSTIKIAAQITTMQGPNNVAEHYKAATTYANALAVKLQEVDAKSFANYETLLLMTQTMTLQGVVLDINNKKQVESFTSLSNAVAMYTAGQNQSIQAHQEIRSLMSGEVHQGSLLAKQIDDMAKSSGLYKNGLKEIVAEGKKHGDMLERLEPFLVGINAASGDISKTWQAVTSSFETAVNVLQRAFFKDMFTDITTAGAAFVNWLKSSEDNVTAWGKNFMRIVYNISAEIIRMGMLLDKVGGTATSAQMLLYGPGKALGVKSSTERFDRAAQNNIDFENRYNEKSTMLENLAIKMNKLDEAATRAGNAVVPKVPLGGPAGAGGKGKLTDQQREYQKQIKEFLKTAWDTAALELAREDFSGDITKKLGLLTPKPAGFTKNPAMSMGVDIQLQSLEQQAAANKKLTEAEAARLAVETELLRVQKEVDKLDRDTARLQADLIEDPYERQKQDVVDRYEAERKQIELTMRANKTSREVQEAGTKKLTALEQKLSKDTAAIDKQSFTGRIAMIGDYAAIGSQLFSGLAAAQDQSSRSGFEAAKNYSMGAAIMSTAAAIIGQLTGPDAWTPAAWARSVVAGLLGAIQIAKIASTSYGGGGSAPTVSAGSFSGGSGGQSAVGGSIGAPIKSVRDSQSQEDFQRIAASMENASLALGRVADGLTKITDLFTEGGLMALAAGAAPGIGGATSDPSKTGLIKGLLALDPMHNATFATNPLDFVKGIGSTLFGWGNSWQTTGGGVSVGMQGGDVMLQNFITEIKKGGWFSSDKHRTTYSPGDPAFNAVLQSALDRIAATINRGAAVTGTSTDFGSAYLAPTNIATAGRKAEDIQKDLEKWFTDAANILAKTVNGLQQFAFYGENAFDAIVRLSTALQSANEGFELIGKGLVASTLRNADAMFRLQDMMGGAEKFTDKIDTYFTSMFSDEEQAAQKAAQATRQVGTSFDEINSALVKAGLATITLPQTKAGFIELVNGLDVTTDSGAKTFAALMDISEAFALVQNQAKEYAKMIQDSQDDLTSRMMRAKGQSTEADLYDLTIAQRKEMDEYIEKKMDIYQIEKLALVQQLELANSVKKASEEAAKAVEQANKQRLQTEISTALSAANALKSIMGGNLSTGSPESLYKGQQAAFAAALANNRKDELPALGQALLTASRAYNASGAGYTSDYDMVTKALADIAGMAGTPAIDSVQAQINVLTDIKNNTALMVTATTTLAQALAQQGAFQNSSTVMRMVTGLEAANNAYDLNNSGVVDMADAMGYLRISRGLPAFATGSPYIPYDMPANVHQGEIIMDRASSDVLRKYGITVSGSADNKETIAELKEANRQLVATVRVLQAGFSKLIEQNEEGNTNGKVLTSKLNLAKAA